MLLVGSLSLKSNLAIDCSLQVARKSRVFSKAQRQSNPCVFEILSNIKE